MNAFNVIYVSSLYLSLQCNAFHSTSKFLGQEIRVRQEVNAVYKKNDITMYDYSHEPPSNENNNIFNVLANTERWISNFSSGKDDTLKRKSVSFVCESNDEEATITAGIFRRLKEARCVGEQHGQSEEEYLAQAGEEVSARTLRETQIVVIPNNNEYNASFQKFNDLIQSINKARRNARDYVTDVSLEKLDEQLSGEAEREWR